MGHPLRLYQPNVVYEVTCYAIQGRRLLRPSDEVNDLIAGIIGRAQDLYPDVRTHGVSVLSNHMTWLISSAVPREIPAFFGHVNGNISREIGTRLHDWPGSLWERRARPIPVLDEESMIERLAYLLAQGTKEGLVASPCDWPGISSVEALLGTQPLVGTWIDRDGETKAKRRGLNPGPLDFATRYTVRFEKIPCWAHLSDEEYAAQVERIIRTIEREAAEARGDRPVLGAQAVLQTDPHERPRTRKKSPAPLCHASSKKTRLAFRHLYRQFVEAFREAAALLRRGVLEVEFPPWSFPPPRPFVHSTA